MLAIFHAVFSFHGYVHQATVHDVMMRSWKNTKNTKSKFYFAVIAKWLRRRAANPFDRNVNLSSNLSHSVAGTQRVSEHLSKARE